MVVFSIETVQMGLNVLPDQIHNLVNSDLANLGNVLAYGYVKDPDILGQMQNAFQYFVKSGQIWALMIGLFLGYMFRSFTSY